MARILFVRLNQSIHRKKAASEPSVTARWILENIFALLRQFGNTLALMADKPLHTTWTNQWTLSISGIANEAVRFEMIRFYERASSIVTKHLIKGSVCLWILVALAVVAGIASGGIVSLKQALQKASGKVLSGPIDPRVIEEQAFCAS